VVDNTYYLGAKLVVSRIGGSQSDGEYVVRIYYPATASLPEAEMSNSPNRSTAVAEAKRIVGSLVNKAKG
jgi:hypothetical protein